MHDLAISDHGYHETKLDRSLVRTIGVIITLAVVATLALVIISAEDADAWTTKEEEAFYGNYRTGYASSGPGGWNKYSSDHIQAWNTTTTISKAWMSFPISDFDNRTALRSITLDFVAIGYSFDNFINVRLLKADPSTMNGPSIFSTISQGYDLGTIDISFVDLMWYSVEITGPAHAYANESLHGGDEFLFIGFEAVGSNSGAWLFLSYGEKTRMTFEYDDEGPDAPILDPLETYLRGTDLRLEWPPVSDRPYGGNVSGVQYQLALFTSDDFSAPPANLTSWGFEGLNATIRDLVDGATYYIRIRAGDGSGFESNWSQHVWTTMDASPPTVPTMLEEPAFTRGDTNTFHWHSSRDAGVGFDHYLVEVSTSPDFDMGTVASARTVNATFTVSGLLDGLRYHSRVRAVDAFGQASDWSPVVSSTQDATGPSAPFLHDLPEYMPPGSVTLTWGSAVDHGVGVTRYQVWWDRPGIGGPPVFLIDVIGQSLTLTDLGEGNWTFGVRAVDGFGHPGPFSDVNTTIDATPPSAPVLEPLPEFSPGKSIKLLWSEASDNGSGMGQYRIAWIRSTNDASLRHVDVGNDTEATIVDLAEGVIYLYQVTAYDLVGNFASSSWVNSTQDASPPRAPYLHTLQEFIDRDPVDLAWQDSHDTGVGGVQYRLYWDIVYGDSHPGWDLSGDSGWIEETFYEVEDLNYDRKYWFEVRARDALGHLSNSSGTVITTIDRLPPMVTIDSPADNESLSGVVSVECSIVEPNLERVTLYYRAGDDGEWVRVADRVDAGVDQFSFPWITSTVPDGSYWLNVTAFDRAGHQGVAEVEVTLANAHLVVSPMDIRFSDESPQVGDSVMLMVAVRNEGDAVAIGTTVEVYDNGELIETLSGIHVGGHSVAVLYFPLEVTGRHEITARVRSDLYDTGRMDPGALLEAEGAGDASDGGGGALGLALGALALAISLVALLLALSKRREAPARNTGEWEESGD